MFDLDRTISRQTFLRTSIKMFALTSLTIQGVHCGPAANVPPLAGISEQEYQNMNALGEVFLADCPIPGIDLGKLFDDYVFGHPTPLDTKALVLELAGVPSSLLASVVLDGSFTPLVKLSRADRERRLLSWKSSDSQMKRGLFNILRQTSFFIASSSPAYLAYAGYSSAPTITPYR